MDWGGVNSRFLGLVSVWVAQSLDHKRIHKNDIKYITHMQSVLAKKKYGNVHKKEKEETV